LVLWPATNPAGAGCWRIPLTGDSMLVSSFAGAGLKLAFSWLVPRLHFQYADRKFGDPMTGQFRPTAPVERQPLCRLTHKILKTMVTMATTALA
jgi:hypothetical protein